MFLNEVARERLARYKGNNDIKQDIRQDVIRTIHEHGGKFVARSRSEEEEGIWEEVSNEVAGQRVLAVFFMYTVTVLLLIPNRGKELLRRIGRRLLDGLLSLTL